MCTNGTVNTSILHTYDSMVAELKTQAAKQPRMELEVIGQTIKGRDIHLVKYLGTRPTRRSSTSPSSTATSS